MRKVLVLGVLLVAACGGGDDDGDASDVPVEETGEEASTITTAEVTTTTEAEPSESIEAYFIAVGAATQSEVAAGLAAASPGSPAATYMEHLGAFPSNGVASETTFSEDGIDSCFQGDCFHYGDVQVDASGLVSNFSINGVDLDSVISSGGEAPAGPATVRLVAAYASPASSNLFVTVDVVNGSDGALIFADYQAAYVGPDGRQLQVQPMGPSPEIRPGATARFVVAFAGGQLGGTYSATVFANDFSDEFAFELPIST